MVLTNTLAAVVLPLALSSLGSVEHEESAPRSRFQDPSPSSVGFMDSAVLPDRGFLQWRSDNLLGQQLTVSLTDFLELGAFTILPVGVAGIVPRAKIGVQLHDLVSVSVTGVGGFLKPLVSLETSGMLYAAGAMAHVTLTTELVHVSLINRFLFIGITGTPRLDQEFWAYQPALGASVRVTDFLRLAVEAGALIHQAHFANRRGPNRFEPGDSWIIQYGGHLHGEHWFLDLSFIVPVLGKWSQLNEVLPIGLPILSIGYTFSGGQP